MRGLRIDSFAGGGGASIGMEMAGYHPDIAINHDEEAISMHRANHPNTRHYNSNIIKVDPLEVTDGQYVDLFWLSPDCTHHSKARGSKPKSKNIRGLAWVAIHWINKLKRRKPKLLVLENVEEFKDWGPLDKNGVPKPHLKGWFFKCFIGALERRGYKVEYRELRACDYGSPTIRKRLFIIARSDGESIKWAEPTHAPADDILVHNNILKPYRTTAECIDWSHPCPSIFNRKKPLAEKTMARIAKGIDKFVLKAKKPYFITEHANGSSNRNMDADEPMRTQCASVKGGHFALVQPFLSSYYGASIGGDVNEPCNTVTTKDRHSLLCAHIISQYGQSVGRSADDPIGTVTSGGMGKQGLVASYISKMRGTNLGHSMEEPLHTISAGGTHHAEVRALLKPKGVGNSMEIDGHVFEIHDIGMRMLQPRELFNAQGFPGDYIIDYGLDRNGARVKLTKTAQVKMCGNSVCPPLASAIIKANMKKSEVVEQLV